MSISKRLLIVGGTHGNELTGVYLIKKFAEFPNLIQRSTFEILTLLANPQAMAAGKRYQDKDLNRCFSPEDLANPHLTNYEEIRAKQISQDIQQKEVDFIIDLHSSTSNMGLTLILDGKHPFLLNLAAYLTSINPLVRILQHNPSSSKMPYLMNLCELGLAIEVGPVAQGVLNAEMFQQTEALILTIFDYLEAYNSGKIPQSFHTLTVYQSMKTIDYPRNEQGEIQAMIHPQLQNQDYAPLRLGSPMFLTFKGEEICYQGEELVFPVFINEAAYYEKNIAMSLTQKIVFDF